MRETYTLRMKAHDLYHVAQTVAGYVKGRMELLVPIVASTLRAIINTRYVDPTPDDR